MATDKKTKLLKVLDAKLTAEQKKLLQLIAFDNRKDKLIARMPVGLFSLDSLWTTVVYTCEELGIQLSRVETFATLEELDDILTDIEWLWKRKIPRGFVTMVVGEPGAGKSYWIVDIARVLTTGDHWPMSDEKPKPSNVLWIETEMKQQLLNVRSKVLGVDRKRISIPSINGNLLQKFDAGVEEHKEHILSLISAKNPALLVLDSLGHSHGRGENKIEEVRPIMDFYTAIARDFNMAVVVVHHLNKGKEGEQAEVSLFRVRGSSDLAAVPVIIYAIEKLDEGKKRLRMIKNNVGSEAPPLLITPTYIEADEEDGERQISRFDYSAYTPPAPKKTKREKCAEWVVGILKERNNDEGVGLKELEEMGVGVGFTRGNIYSAKDVLGDRIAVTGTGRSAFWHLANFDDDDSIGEIANASQKNK